MRTVKTSLFIIILIRELHEIQTKKVSEDIIFDIWAIAELIEKSVMIAQTYKVFI